jgi:hypothetical protein
MLPSGETQDISHLYPVVWFASRVTAKTLPSFFLEGPLSACPAHKEEQWAACEKNKRETAIAAGTILFMTEVYHERISVRAQRTARDMPYMQGGKRKI